MPSPSPTRTWRPLGGARLLVALLAAAGCAEEEKPEEAEAVPFVDADGDGWPLPQDCDDALFGIHPGASETCNGSDDDCDGVTDDAPVDGIEAWLDYDRDGWGAEGTRDRWCGDSEADPRPWVSLSGDCDDGDVRVHPGATESCGTDADDDCDGTANDPDALNCEPWYLDLDGDGLGTEEALCLCEAEGSWRGDVPGDCDDGDATRTDACGIAGARDLSAADTRIAGVTGTDGAGSAIAAGGDPDQDGWPDLLVGAAHDGRPPGLWRLGGPFGGAADLAAPTAAYSLTTLEALYAVRVAGGHDLDGDAVDDVVLAVYGETATSGARVHGRVYVVSGNTTGTVDLAFPDAFLETTGTTSVYDLRVAVTPDTDGDGLADLLVGGTDARTVTLYTGPLTGTITPADAAVTLTADGSTELGAAIATPGDVDGDGLADYALGAPRADGTVGEVWLVPGGLSGAARREQAFATISASDGGTLLFGAEVAAPGDVDGDGEADLLVGGYPTDLGSSATGGAWLFTGPLAGALTTSDATARVEGSSVNELALFVAGPGDVDGDGRGDIAIGAPGNTFHGDSAGAAFLFFGPVTGRLRTTEADVRLYGTAVGDGAGTTVAGAGDLDADGFADVLVGAPGADLGALESGAVYVIRGGER